MPYRAVVRHVRYWRGSIHRWSTVYPFIGTPSSALTASDAELVRVADSKMCYGLTSAAGGAYECQLYDQASGGVPIAVSVAFDYTVPASWAGYPASIWPAGGTGPAEPAEAALLVEWAAGLSSSGKPVKLKKWYHSVPNAVMSASADVSSTAVTALTAQANAITGVLGAKGLSLGSPSGRFAGAASVKPFYSNHQLQRGRRKSVSGARAQADYSRILQIVNGEASDLGA